MATPRPTAKPTPTASRRLLTAEHEHAGHDHRRQLKTATRPPHDHHDVTDGGRLPLSSAMVLLLALSFHSFLEGLGMGSAESHDDTLSLLLLIALHKGLAAFALGMSFLGAGLGRRATKRPRRHLCARHADRRRLRRALRARRTARRPRCASRRRPAPSSTSRSSRCCRASSRRRAARRRTLLAALPPASRFAALAVWL